MSWSPAFVAALSSRVAVPVFRLDIYKQAGAPGNTGASLYSHRGISADYSFAISRNQLRMTSAMVTPGTWSTSYGGIVVGLHGGAEVVSDLLSRSIVRGSMCRLFMGFEGWASDDFEPIFIGQIRQLGGSPTGGYFLEAWDVLSALGSRWTTTRGEEALFFNLREDATTTIATTAYSVGDATIEVATSASFEREDSANYLLRVTGDSGATFLLVASSVASDVFTIDSPGSDRYGTTRESAAIGNKVKHVALLQDHPKDLVRKLLVSTGTAGAAHATWDKYPAGWAWGMPIEWVDLDDIDDAMTRLQVNTTTSLDVVVTEAQLNPASWLSGVLDDAGFWLVHRQGQISLRAATNPLLTSPGPVYSVTGITDTDIQRVLRYQAWAGEVAIEYPSVVTADANGATTTSNEGITTLPAAKTYLRTLAHAWTSGSTHRTDADGRLKIWHHRVPERVSLELMGWANAGLVPGDMVSLTSAHIPSRAGGTMDGRKALVLGCAPDWLEGVTQLDLAIIPEWDTEFPS